MINISDSQATEFSSVAAKRLVEGLIELNELARQHHPELAEYPPVLEQRSPKHVETVERFFASRFCALLANHFVIVPSDSINESFQSTER